MELGVTDPVPAINASAVAHQFQQGFWRSAQARLKQVARLKRLSVGCAAGRGFYVQLMPGQAPMMCSGVCLAHSAEVASTDRFHSEHGLELGDVSAALAHGYKPRSGAVPRLRG